MSVGQCVRFVARVGANFAYRSKMLPPLSYKASEVNKGGLNNKTVLSSLYMLPNVSRLPHMSPSAKLRIEIIDPMAGILGNKKSPSRQWGHQEMTLPNLKVDELVEPPTPVVIEKKAARLIVIRRAKMKKHKWRKLQKKMKFVFARKRQKKELKKEKAFQAVLLAQIKDAEQFEAEKYVSSKLKIAHWERPITRVRGFFAPDWVIRDHLREQEEKRRIQERIDECLRLKK